MNLLIFGASGSIGLPLVHQALALNHSVKAFCRQPQRLSVITHPRLQVIVGDVLDEAAVRKAVQEVDAVLCAIGDGNKGKVRAAGTKNIVEAMAAEGIKRFICQTTLGLGESRGNLNFVWKYVMFGLLLKKAYRDHELQETIVRESNIDWTIVRPSAFTDGGPTCVYKHDFDGREKKLTLKIRRTDVAEFMLRQLTSPAYLKKAVSVSN